MPALFIRIWGCEHGPMFGVREFVAAVLRTKSWSVELFRGMDDAQIDGRLCIWG
jgi:hypothetical protein